MVSPAISNSGEDAGEMDNARSELVGIMERVRSVDEDRRIEAAREIRRLTKTSSRGRRILAGSIEPLVSMLRSGSSECGEAAILAILNLAVKDERNKIKIVDAGALDPLVGFLQSPNPNMQEYATAALLTLSASHMNKPIISSTGAIPLLVMVLRDGSLQAKIDAVMTLYNLSTIPANLNAIISSQPIPPLIDLLKTSDKSSKTTEKCSALLESLLAFDEGRTAVTAEEGGVLAIVEVLEDGSLRGREHAVGSLLAMCESDRWRYREVILNEGAIPGLLELTVQGTPRARSNALKLLRLLRNSPCQRSELEMHTLENIIYSIVSQIKGEDHSEKAKKMLADMVHVSMEQSLRHLQRRAFLCTPTE